MRWGDGIGVGLRGFSRAHGNEISDQEQGPSTDGCLRAELHASGLARQHPDGNLERCSRWIADGYRAVATMWRSEYFQRLPEVRVEGVMNRDTRRDGIATL
jgi:hypothetical protein